jgi:hypothetical protein
MTRQEMFKRELVDLLIRYDVEMTVNDEMVNFFSYLNCSERNEKEMINLNVREIYRGAVFEDRLVRS